MAVNLASALYEDTEMMINPENIPSALLNSDRWLRWKPVTRANGKTGKVPYNARGQPANVSRTSDCATFEECNAGHDGIGFLLGAGIVGIDVDNCVNEKGLLNDHATQIVRELDSFTEYSPSGTGLHILINTSYTHPICRNQHVEIYTGNRFFTVTGNLYKNYDALREVDASEFQEFCERWLPTKSLESVPMASDNLSADDVFNRARGDSVFHDLMMGRGNADASANDFALCCKLAFYSGGNPQLIDQIFRKSRLIRKKWDSKRGTKTYGAQTIERAIAKTPQRYQAPELITQGGGFPVVENTDRSPAPEMSVIKSKDSLPAQSTLAEHLQKTLPDLSFDYIREEWMTYNGVFWEMTTKRNAYRLINDAMRQEVGEVGYSSSFLSGTASLLEVLAGAGDWNTDTNLIPFRNGIYQISTSQLLPHRRENRVTWCIPYDYDKSATCPNVQQWLSECVDGQKDQVQLLRAYMAAILRGRADLQRYLELIGPGGTGKGTFIRLCESLVGVSNCHSTELKQLEQNRFETANLYGKRLITITDSQGYAGDVSVLKAMTGEDTLRYEEKNKQSRNGFKLQGMVIIAANEAISSKDYTSGIHRRRVTVAFRNRVKSAERRELLVEFSPQLPGVVNWALSLPDETITALVRDTATTVPSLADTAMDNMLATNPMAQWVDDNVVYSDGEMTQIGNANQCADDRLYPNYCQYCKDNGYNPLSIVRFVGLLEELFSAQLGYSGVERVKLAQGKFMINLELRNVSHNGVPSPVEHAFHSFAKNPVNPANCANTGSNPA